MTRRPLTPLFEPKIRYGDLGPVPVWKSFVAGGLTDQRDTATGTASAYVWADAAITDFSSAAAGNGSTQVVLTLPSHADGDLLVILFYVVGTMDTYPAGWTNEGSDGQGGCFTKVASSEPATVTFTISGTVPGARCATAYCWTLEGSDNTAYDVGLNAATNPSYTFTGGGLVLMQFRGYGDASSAFNPDNVTDANNNIGTPIGVYNFAAGHYGQVGGGAPTGQLFDGRITVASGGDNKSQTIRIARFAQLVV